MELRRQPDRAHALAGITYTAWNLLGGACLVARTPHHDERGTFDRLYDPALLGMVAGRHMRVAQGARVTNPTAGTLRGLHFQTGTFAEEKLVMCAAGRIVDVMLDLRSDSPTYGQHAWAELSGGDELMVFVPKGFAHGYLTLEPGTVVHYLTSAPYTQTATGGVHWQSVDSPAWGMGPVSLVGERDRGLPHDWPRLEVV